MVIYLVAPTRRRVLVADLPATARPEELQVFRSEILPDSRTTKRNTAST